MDAGRDGGAALADGPADAGAAVVGSCVAVPVAHVYGGKFGGRAA